MKMCSPNVSLAVVDGPDLTFGYVLKKFVPWPQTHQPAYRYWHGPGMIDLAPAGQGGRAENMIPLP